MKVRSRKPRKQRNARRRVKPHQRSKLLRVRVDEEITHEWGIKRLPVRKDDQVRVIAGEFVGVEGKVLEVRKRDLKVIVEECMQEKKDGSSYYVPISPNKLVLVKFGEKKKLDPWREKMMNRMQQDFGEPVVTPPKKGGK